METIKNEPALIVSFIMALLMTLGAYGVLQLSPEQVSETENLVSLGVTIFLPIISGIVIRQQVTPVNKLK